jgi:hypothetical protein
MSSDNSVRTHDYSLTPIRKTASIPPTTNELIETLVRTRAFKEIAQAIVETTIDIRDTANEVSETVTDLIEAGTIKDIATVVAETAKVAFNTIEIVKTAINHRAIPKHASP